MGRRVRRRKGERGSESVQKKSFQAVGNLSGMYYGLAEERVRKALRERDSWTVKSNKTRDMGRKTVGSLFKRVLNNKRGREVGFSKFCFILFYY